MKIITVIWQYTYMKQLFLEYIHNVPSLATSVLHVVVAFLFLYPQCVFSFQFHSRTQMRRHFSSFAEQNCQKAQMTLDAPMHVHIHLRMFPDFSFSSDLLTGYFLKHKKIKAYCNRYFASREINFQPNVHYSVFNNNNSANN